MDEQNFKLIMKTYYDFRNNLSTKINNINLTLYSEDCYLIEEPWINELINCFNQCNNNLKNSHSSFKFDFSLPSNPPVFIQNFDGIIKNIKDFKKFRIVNKNLIEFFYKDLNGIPIVKYYTGNNKIIIEFKENRNNKALLLINPLDEAPFINKAFILLINDNQKFKLYKDLLNEIDNSNIKSKPQYNKVVVQFEEYSKNNQNKPNEIKKLNIINKQQNKHPQDSASKKNKINISQKKVLNLTQRKTTKRQISSQKNNIEKNSYLNNTANLNNSKEMINKSTNIILTEFKLDNKSPNNKLVNLTDNNGVSEIKRTIKYFSQNKAKILQKAIAKTKTNFKKSENKLNNNNIKQNKPNNLKNGKTVNNTNAGNINDILTQLKKENKELKEQKNENESKIKELTELNIYLEKTDKNKDNEEFIRKYKKILDYEKQIKDLNKKYINYQKISQNQAQKIKNIINIDNII